jgi:hypothetical protein
MAKKPNSFFGWLGRQIGHVKRAVKQDVPKIVYKKTTVHEATLPDRPDEKIRRTVVDEVIRNRPRDGQAS